jgi:hypothetical protein
MITTAFAMKDAVLRELKLLPELAALLADDAIWDNGSQDSQRRHRLIWIGEIDWTSDDPATFGKGTPSREEEYNIRFGIEVNESDATQTDANNKVRDLLGVIETLVNDKRKFGVAGLITTGVVPIALGEGAASGTGGRAANLAAVINVRARK